MSQIKKLNLSQTIALVVSVSSAVLLITFLVRAWVEPFAVPPGGTVYTPVNTGPTAQTKEGNLQVNALSTFDTAVSDNTIETGTLCLGNGINCESEWPSGEFIFTAGNVLLASDDTEVSTNTYSSYLHIKTILVGAGGTLRIEFDLKGSWDARAAYARIYRNGSPIGTERILYSESYTTYTEDISGWQSGDQVSMYIKSTYNFGGSPHAYVKNFRIYVDSYPGVPVHY